MAEKHPTFPNPTIREALCEIHFRLREGAPWQDSLFVKMFIKVQEKFPDMELVTQPALQLQAGPDGVKLLSPQRRMRFKQVSRNVLLQLSENIFTVNVLPKYPGWAQTECEILDGWTQAREVLQPASIARIGLRYINDIERKTSDERPGDWLAPSDYISKAVLDSLPGFLSRSETRMDAENRVVVTVGEAASDPDRNVSGLVFDIDCIVEKEITPEDDAVRQELAKLHETAWDIFSASMTPSLESVLAGDNE